MVLYSTKTIPESVFVSRGVLYDLMRIYNGKAKEKDIQVIGLITPNDEYPLHIYRTGLNSYSISPENDSTPIDVIMQKYPEREEWHDVLMEKAKGRATYSCKIPVNADRDGYLTADADGMVEYYNDKQNSMFKDARIGMARVKAVDEINRIVAGHMYTYHMPSGNELKSAWNEIVKTSDQCEMPIAPVYEYSGKNTSFSVIQTMHNTYIIYNILHDDNSEDIIVLDHNDAQYYIADQEALAFIRDIHNMNGKRTPAYYTLDNYVSNIKKNDEVYSRLKEVSSIKMHQPGKTIKGENDEWYSFTKMKNTSDFVLNNTDTPIGKLIELGLIDVYVYQSQDNSSSKPLYYLKIQGTSHPMYLAIWANIFSIADNKTLKVLDHVMNLNKHTLKHFK